MQKVTNEEITTFLLFSVVAKWHAFISNFALNCTGIAVVVLIRWQLVWNSTNGKSCLIFRTKKENGPKFSTFQ